MTDVFLAAIGSSRITSVTLSVRLSVHSSVHPFIRSFFLAHWSYETWIIPQLTITFLTNLACQKFDWFWKNTFFPFWPFHYLVSLDLRRYHYYWTAPIDANVHHMLEVGGHYDPLYFTHFTVFALLSTFFVCWGCNLTWSSTMHVKLFHKLLTNLPKCFKKYILHEI